MGLRNQGWCCSCDQCGEQALHEVGGYTKSQMRALARRQGFIQVKTIYWFCGTECLREWISSKENDPDFQKHVRAAASGILSRLTK